MLMTFGFTASNVLSGQCARGGWFLLLHAFLFRNGCSSILGGPVLCLVCIDTFIFLGSRKGQTVNETYFKEYQVLFQPDIQL